MRAVRNAVAGDEILVRRVPLGPLPAVRFEEFGAQVRGAVVERRPVHAALGLPLLARMHDAVRLVEVLAAALPDVLLGPLVRVETA